jgi:aspartate 4-decarboxylase
MSRDHQAHQGRHRELAELYQSGSLGRRDFFRLAGFLGLSASVLAGLGLPAAALALSPKEKKALDQESPFEIKNLLIEKARKASAADPSLAYINAGRGNPDFLNTTARQGMAQLMAMAAALSAQGVVQADLGFRVPRPGLADKARAWLQEYGQGQGAEFLLKALDHAQSHLRLDPDELCFELIDAAQGDFYPDPPRILPVTEQVVNAYLAKVLYAGSPPAGRFRLFATEGATAAMVYVFDSLKVNGVLRPGDHIAIFTPIFSPYLEIPALKEYSLVQVHLAGDEQAGWRLPDSEVAKLADPRIKALFLVNPTNPTSTALDQDTVRRVAQVVKAKNPEMVVINDTVYATFVEEFHTLAEEIPENTIGVYSYSKYFGVTGWRLGVVAIHENCVVDRIIAKLPAAEKKALARRYRLTSTKPGELKFYQRLEMDSRDVALAHTGGLSGPQQAAMCLFSLFELMDTRSRYQATIRGVLKERWVALYQALGRPAPDGPKLTRYYALIDLLELARAAHGERFAAWLEKRWPLAFLIRLAERRASVCLPGAGFAGPEWSLRVALANVKQDECAAVGKNILAVMDQYHAEFQKAAG